MLEVLSPDETNLLKGIARRSKMDCWFCVTLEGRCKDLENGGKLMPTSDAIRQLVEGMTFEDFSCLTDYEKFKLVNILLKLC